MQELPPHVKAWADELLAVAPPLTEEAERAIRALAPYARRELAEHPTAEPVDRTPSPHRGAAPGPRPLPVVAGTAARFLREDVQRLERLFADSREQVAEQVRSHLDYAAEACQAMLRQLDEQAGS